MYSVKVSSIFQHLKPFANKFYHIASKQTSHAWVFCFAHPHDVVLKISVWGFRFPRSTTYTVE